MKCRACGEEGAITRYCCADQPVFCDVCNALHQKRAHPEPQKELFEEKDRSARKM